jgi:hypothetical protein
MRIWRTVQVPWWRVPACAWADIRETGFREWLYWQRLGRDTWWGITYDYEDKP